MRKPILLIVPLLALMLGGGPVLAQGDSQSGSARFAGAWDSGLLQPGTPAPNFAANGWDGGSTNLADYRGRIVVLDFWATWCGPCNAAMPHLQDISDRFQSDNVVVLGLCCSDTARNAYAWIRSHQYNFTFAVDPAGRDTNHDIAKSYGVTGLPSTFVINTTGMIAASGVCMSESEIADALEKLGARGSGASIRAEPRSNEVGRSEGTIGSIGRPLQIKGYMSGKIVDPYACLTETGALAKAHALIDKGRFGDASALAKSMEKRGFGKHLGSIYNALGDQAASTGKIDEAWGWYLLTVRNAGDPTSIVHAHFGLADYFKAIGQPGQAQTELQAIVNLPGVADADKTRAQSCLDKAHS